MWILVFLDLGVYVRVCDVHLNPVVEDEVRFVIWILAFLELKADLKVIARVSLVAFGVKNVVLDAQIVVEIRYNPVASEV